MFPCCWNALQRLTDLMPSLRLRKNSIKIHDVAVHHDWRADVEQSKILAGGLGILLICCDNFGYLYSPGAVKTQHSPVERIAKKRFLPKDPLFLR